MKKPLAFLIACLALFAAAPAFAFGGSHWTSWAHRPWIIRDEPGLVMWVRADQGVTLNSTTVATWADFSGQGSNFTAAGSTQPLFVVSAQNGEPALRFDGTDDTMVTGAVTRTVPRDVYCVIKFTSVGGGDTLFNDATTGDTLQFGQDNFPESYTRSGGFGPFLLTPVSPVANGSYATLRTTFTGAGSVIFVNGTQQGSNGTAMNSGTGWRLGANSAVVVNKYAHVEIGEFIELNAVQSSTEAARIQFYLKTFWATP